MTVTTIYRNYQNGDIRHGIVTKTNTQAQGNNKENKHLKCLHKVGLDCIFHQNSQSTAHTLSNKVIE